MSKNQRRYHPDGPTMREIKRILQHADKPLSLHAIIDNWTHRRSPSPQELSNIFRAHKNINTIKPEKRGPVYTYTWSDQI